MLPQFGFIECVHSGLQNEVQLLHINNDLGSKKNLKKKQKTQIKQCTATPLQKYDGWNSYRSLPFHLFTQYIVNSFSIVEN